MKAKAYKIVTERLIIRCYQPQDAVLLKKSIDESLEHLKPWMPWAEKEPETLEAKLERTRKCRGQFDLGLDFVFGIFSKDEKNLIGSTGLHTRIGENAREIGYWINVNFLKLGYATETVKALVKIGFEIEALERIEIRCSPNNLASQAIPKKIGFVHEATLKNRKKNLNGGSEDVMIWTLFKEDYLKSSLTSFNLTAFDIAGNKIETSSIA